MKTILSLFTKYFSGMTVILCLVMYSAPLVTLAGLTVELENPLNNISTIDGLLIAILNIIMVLMVPVIVFFIIYAGFKYVMAQGNASQVEEATRALTYAVIGGVLILGAVAISQIIQNVVNSF